ncbi:MAG: DUF4350 domain-containing protein [Candidatus Odinarchaeota archaeon]
MKFNISAVAITFILAASTISLIFNPSSSVLIVPDHNDLSMQGLDLSRIIDGLDGGGSKTLIFAGKSMTEKQTVIEKIQKAGGEIKTDFKHIPGFIFSVPIEKTFYWENFPGVLANTMFQLVEKPLDMLEQSYSGDTLATGATAEEMELVDAAGAKSLWDEGKKGSGVKIAILDTGVDSSHTDIEVLEGHDFSFVTTDNGFSTAEDTSDNHGHGTHVAGIAAGKGISTKKYAGVAPEATLINLKVANQNGNSYPAAVMEALEKAVELDVDIISISLGFSQDVNDPMALFLDSIVEQDDIIVVASAGNDGPDTYTATIPGASRKTITVGATDFNRVLAAFSSRGPAVDERIEPDVVAPGVMVTAPLAKDSILDYAAHSLKNPFNWVRGGRSGNDYIQLSGTSMSAPLVAGAVALLKEKHPSASPFAIRAALMSGSDDMPGTEEYETGAGYINITAADIELENQREDTVYKNFYVHPSNRLLPWNVVVYPGDEFVVQPTVISGYKTDFSFRTDGLNGSSFIILNETSVTSTDYVDFRVTIKIPQGTPPGTYVSSLIVEDDNNAGVTKTVNLGPLEVKIPEKTVYFDLFHSLSFDDSLLVNYYELYRLLAGQGYQVEQYTSPLSNNIFSYDMVVIADPEVDFSSDELSIIRDYVSTGGNLLLMSSFSPFSQIPGLNAITSPYGISWDQSLQATLTDTGLSIGISPLFENLTLLETTHALFSNVNNLTWYAGTTLDVRSPSRSLVSLDGNPVYAAFEGNDTVTGKILALGQELPFYNSWLGEEQNEQFALNAFSWLTDRGLVNTTVIHLENHTSAFNINSTLNTWIYATSASGSVITGNSAGINISLILPNGTRIDNLSPEETIPGVYLFSFNETDKPGSYRIVVETSAGTKSLEAIISEENSLQIVSFTFSDTYTGNKNLPVQLEDVDTTFLDRDKSSLKALAVIDNSTKLQKVTVHLNSVPEGIYDLMETIPEDGFYSKTLELIYSIHGWGYTWDLPADLPSGLYYAYLEVLDANNETAVEIGSFYVLNHEPVINLDTSAIEGEALRAFENPSENYGRFNRGSIIDISLQVSDYEDTSGLQCFYILANIPAFLGYGGIYIDAGELNKSASIFVGQIRIPSAEYVQVGEYFEILTGSDQLLAFILVVRDSEGSYDYFSVYFVTQGSLDLSLLQVFLVFGLIAALVLGTLYYFAVMKPKRSQRLSYEEYLYQRQAKSREHPPPGGFRPGPYQPYTEQWQQPSPPGITARPRFCGFCGSPLVNPNQKFCMNCGKELDFES